MSKLTNKLNEMATRLSMDGQREAADLMKEAALVLEWQSGTIERLERAKLQPSNG